MNREDWKAKRLTKDVLGVNVLQKTIDDYEVKLCDNHTTILNLEYNKQSLKETIYELKKELQKEKSNGDRQYKYYAKEKKQMEAAKRASLLLIENTETKWFQMGVRRQIIEKLKHFMSWGY